MADWDAQYKLYIDPETHTERQIETTRTAYTQTRSLLSGIQQQVKNSKAVTLTDADIDNLYIHRDAPRRGRVPVPSVAPDNVLLASKHLTNRISTFEPSPGIENHLGLPADVSRVGRKIALVPQGEPAPQASDYHPLDSSGAGAFNLVWQPEQAEHNCYLITWFINFRGESGPESLPFKFAII